MLINSPVSYLMKNSSVAVDLLYMDRLSAANMLLKLLVPKVPEMK
jgi:hypothetical protein